MTVKVASLVAWFFVFTIGLRLDSTILPTDTPLGLSMFVITSTTTNVGILAILASLFRNDGNWLASIQRGFVIYLMIISGIVVLFTESLASPTAEQYGKIAGLISLVCLVSSYKPQLYDSFLNRIADVFSGPKDDESTA